MFNNCVISLQRLTIKFNFTFYLVFMCLTQIRPHKFPSCRHCCVVVASFKDWVRILEIEHKSCNVAEAEIPQSAPLVQLCMETNFYSVWIYILWNNMKFVLRTKEKTTLEVRWTKLNTSWRVNVLRSYSSCNWSLSPCNQNIFLSAFKKTSILSLSIADVKETRTVERKWEKIKERKKNEEQVKRQISI